jgi:urease accessory protein
VKHAAAPTLPQQSMAAASALANTLGGQARELAAFQDEPAQMASGAVGKNAWLRLGFERRGERTILADLDRRVPFIAQRVLYPDVALPDQAWIFIITTTGCVLQGDRFALDVSLGPGARAHVTTQSATKIHSMDANYAVQAQTITLADDSYLELLPEPLIPHRRARFLSDTRISIAPSASLLYAEIVQPGRKYHHAGEAFGATLLSLAVEAQRPDGRLLCSEKLLIEPASRPVRQTGVMGDFDVFGNVLLLTPPDCAQRIQARVGADLDLEEGVASGACVLPNDAGLVFKALGRETAQVKAEVRKFWGIAREEITGAPLPPPYFWR